MKTIFRSVLALLAVVFIASSCSDVPAPYNVPDEEEEGGGENQPSTDAVFEQDFAGGQGAFTIVNTKKPSEMTSEVWTYQSGFKSMVAKAFINPNRYETESYLVSPEIDLSSYTGDLKAVITNAASYFNNQDNLKAQTAVVVSTDNGTTWTPLTLSQYATGTSFDFVDSEASLTPYAGKKIKLGFKYTSTTSLTGTWEISKVTVEQGKAAEGGTNEGGGETPAPTDAPGTLTKAADITEGTYVFAYNNGKTYKLMKNLTKSINYVDCTDWTTGTIPADCQFTFTKSGDGWTIQGSDNKYVYAEESSKNGKTYLNLKVGGASPTGTWTFTDDTNGVKAQFADFSTKWIAYSNYNNYNEYTMGYSGSDNFYPTLYKLK